MLNYYENNFGSWTSLNTLRQPVQEFSDHALRIVVLQ